MVRNMSNFSSTVTKCPDGKYRVDYSYLSNGKRKRTCKRGFILQKEAKLWQSKELPKLIAKLEGTEDIKETLFMENLIDEYMDFSKLRRRETTCETKRNIIETKITPFFKGKKAFYVSRKDIIEWQNYLLQLKKSDGTGYAPTYLRTISNQLSAIFNYAGNKYDLQINPVLKVERIGKKKAPQRDIWTLEEYTQISKCLQDTPMWYYAFEILFWCGIREGELLALTPRNFDLEKCIIKITNSYARLNRKDIVGDTKTDESYRAFKIPQKLAIEIKEYMDSFYGVDDDTRIFPMTKKSLYSARDKACAESGVKRITIHDIRHSHISLLENCVNSATTKSISNRAGHTNTNMTLHYAHMYEGQDSNIAKELNEMMGE